MGQGTPYVITIGNEKGGTGKSTVALHVAVALLDLGFEVACLDFDPRQATLSRSIENRIAFDRLHGLGLAVPPCHRLPRAEAIGQVDVPADWFEEILGGLGDRHFVLIDTPGAYTAAARLALSRADTLVTPLNDSLADIDLLARLDVARREALAPSVYTLAVWEQNNLRVADGRAPIDWIVMRNRVAQTDARNKRDVEALLALLAKRLGFRQARGFGDRVVFRELFDRGLTVLDLLHRPGLRRQSPSHDAARAEIRDLLEVLGVVEPVPA